MRRFFARICADEIDGIQAYADSTIGENVISFYGEARSYTGLEPWDFYFSSGIIEDDQFENLEQHISPLHDCIFIAWSGENWEDIVHYYDNLMTSPPEQLRPI